MKTISREKASKIVFVNIVITFIISSLLAFCIDGFVRHPIPSQQNTEYLNLELTDTTYADAIVLDEEHVLHQFGDIFLVDLNGEVHLLYFKHHFQTDRYALTSDVIVDDVSSQIIKVGTAIEQVTVFIEDSKIVNTSTGPMSVSFYYSIYLLVGMIFTVCESVILWSLLKRRLNHKS